MTNRKILISVLIATLIIAAIFLAFFLNKNNITNNNINDNKNSNLNTNSQITDIYSVKLITDLGEYQLDGNSLKNIYSKNLLPRFIFTKPESVAITDIVISIGEDYNDILNDPFIKNVSVNGNGIEVQFSNILFPKNYTISFGKKNGTINTFNIRLIVKDGFSDSSLNSSPLWSYATSSKGKFNNWSINNGKLISSPLPADMGEVVSSLPFLLRFGDNATFTFNFKPAPSTSRLAFYFLESNVTVILGHSNNKIQLIQEGRIVEKAEYPFNENITYKIKITKNSNEYALYISGENEDFSDAPLLKYVSSNVKKIPYYTIGFTQWSNSGGDIQIDDFEAYEGM